MTRSPNAEALLGALRALGGRATSGDVAAKTALPLDIVESEILAALSLVGGHVAVDEKGRLIYAVDRTRRVPPLRTWWQRVSRASWLTFQTIFFAALSIALVAYGIFYIALLLTLAVMAIVAAARGGDCDCDCGGCDCGKGCDCKGCECTGCNSCGDKVHAKTVARNRPEKIAARQDLRLGQRAAREIRRTTALSLALARRARWANALHEFRTGGWALGRDLEPEVVTANPPFLRAVRDFVFGPPRPPEDPAARDKNLLGFIRAHAGRITATDAVMVTGLPIDQADRVLLDLAARMGGDVEATESSPRLGSTVGGETTTPSEELSRAGAVVYTFDRVMPSAASDLESLDWILAAGGTTTAAELATREGRTATDAAAHLSRLAALAGGRVVHGETTRYEFPENARALARDAGAGFAALRDFTYVWERREKAPAILGVPPGRRGWIWGFNVLNVLVSSGLCIFYGSGARLLDTSWEVAILGLFPLAMSLSVFVIPLARALVEGIRNRGRRRRNAHRYSLLALVNRLERRPAVRPEELVQDLALGSHRLDDVRRHTERFLRELEGDYDPAEPEVLRFERAHRELNAVQHARDELDPRAFSLAPIAYDTADQI